MKLNDHRRGSHDESGDAEDGCNILRWLVFGRSESRPGWLVRRFRRQNSGFPRPVGPARLVVRRRVRRRPPKSQAAARWQGLHSKRAQRPGVSHCRWTSGQKFPERERRRANEGEISAAGIACFSSMPRQSSCRRDRPNQGVRRGRGVRPTFGYLPSTENASSTLPGFPPTNP